jgi:RHS repeat-associated protein
LTAVGDWTSVTTNGTAQSRTHGPTHELLTAGGQNVATDVKGNITTLPANLRPTGATTAMNLTWDSDNKLRSADIDANGTADVNFQYDALGRRVARSGTGGSVVYVQMDQQTIADYPVGGAATTPTFRYVYASYIDEPVVRKTAGTGGTLVYFHRNHQYSITAVTTSAGAIAERYAYSAYGQPTILDGSGSVLSSSATNNRYTYTGREWDATLGLYHFRARWMSGIAGRFMGRDPIGYVQNNFEPYSLGGARPMIWIDPTGEIALRLSEFVQDGKPKRDEPKKDYNDCQFLPDTPKECKGGYCLSTKDPKVGNCKITSVVGDKDNSYVCRLVTPERICSHLKKTVEDSGKTNPGKTIEHDFCSNGCSCDYANAKMNDAPFFIILINDVVMQERPGIVSGFTCKFTISGTIEVTGGSVAILPCKKAGK